MRAITRVTGVSLNTVTKLLIDAGKACWAYYPVMRFTVHDFD